MYLSEKEPYNKVVYSGTAFKSNKFSLILSIKEDFAGKAEVIVKLAASLNPLLKMIAAQYIDRFLGTLVDEMEKFRGWKNITT
jgi:hypothetical protein